MAFAHAKAAIDRTAVRDKQYCAVRIAVDQPRNRAENSFCKRVRNLSFILQFPGVRNALPPDGITRGTDQAGIITGYLAWIDRRYLLLVR
jgi:hypothetical protein